MARPLRLAHKVPTLLRQRPLRQLAKVQTDAEAVQPPKPQAEAARPVVLPKEYMLPLRPPTLNTWLSHGVPTHVLRRLPTRLADPRLVRKGVRLNMLTTFPFGLPDEGLPPYILVAYAIG